MSDKSNAGRKPIGFTEEEVLAAIEGSRGIVLRVANKLQCDWTTADKYVKSYPSCMLAMDSELEKVLDTCEDKVHKAISLEDMHTIKWFLSKKGKARGYGDELAVAAVLETKAPIVLNIAFRPPEGAATETASPEPQKKPRKGKS